jgi:hypothetical protein
MTDVVRTPMPIVFKSGDLDDDEFQARRELLLAPSDDAVSLKRLRALAREHEDEVVVREALAGDERQPMLVFGYVVALPDGGCVVWKGTLDALAEWALGVAS